MNQYEEKQRLNQMNIRQEKNIERTKNDGVKSSIIQSRILKGMYREIEMEYSFQADAMKCERIKH